MLKTISIICICLCVVVIAYVIKIYLEMPKIKKFPKEKDKYIY